MTRRGVIAGLALLAMLAAAAAAQVPAAAALVAGLQAVRDTPPADPFPIRRVLLANGAPLPAAADGNPFRRLPREEFEARVRAAAAVPPPTLVQARYRATFADDALTGTGEWTVSAAGDSPLSLDPLTVAVRDAKWPDGRDALVWGSPAKLWADRRGRTPVAFAWSARGTDEPGAVRFDLGLPAAPLAVLDLDLPADRVPTARRGQLLVGPTPRPGNRAGWTLAFGGESRLEFAVRQAGGAGLPSPFATFARTARFDLTPGLATVTVEFDVTAVRGPLPALDFDLDPGLTVTDVTAPGLESWQAADRRLTVTFREPPATAVVTVAAVAVVPTAGEAWPVPTVRPPGPLTDDRLDVKLAADVKLDGVSPGDYRPTRAAADALAFRGGLSADGTRRPPSLRLRAAAAEFATTDVLDWRIEPGRSSLTGRFRVSVARGPLTRLLFRVPAGFAPLAAVLTPDDPTAAWTNAGGGLWALEPTHPVGTGEAVDVRVELRGPAVAVDPPDARPTLAVPVVSAVAAAKRDGTLTVNLAPALRGWLSTGDLRPLKYAHDPAATLTLATKVTVPPDPSGPAEAETPAEERWRFTDLAVAVTLDAAGTPRAELTGRVRAAAGRTLWVGLPAGSVVESATVDGKWADAAAEGAARLPVPTPDADGVAFAVAYRLPRLGSPPPDLPGSPPVRTTWTLGPHHRLWPTLAATADVLPADADAVPAAAVRGVGFALAAVLVGFVLTRLLRGAGRSSRLLLLLAAAGLGTAAWLAPGGWRAVVGPPLVVALLGLLAVTRPKPRAVATVLLVGLVVPATAQAPEAATVYFLQESPAEPNRLTALVPQAVLYRLALLATPALPPLVVTDAEYAGAETDGTAHFTATWAVHVTRDGPQYLLLPLAGVRLEAVTLDGTAAYPDALPNQYALAVAGKGRHEVKAAFAVPITSTGGDREVRFGVPDLLSSRVSVTTTGRQPSLAGRAGRQTLVRTDAGTTLAADLGRGGTVALRWRDGAGDSPPVARVTEATVWDLADGRATAHAAFAYQIARGSLSRLAFDIPPGLEPGAVSVRGATADSPTGLRNLSLTPAGNGQRLAVELQTPAEGALAVTFRLFPKESPTLRPTLRLPRAAGVDVTASYLGVRLAGVTADNWQLDRLADVPADVVARDFALVPGFDFDKTLTRSLRRDGAGQPVARPTLRVPTPPTATHELTWTLGPRADVVGVVRWPPGSPATVVECDVPPGVALVDVTAADLAGWQRSGNRVRAWFKSDAKDPTLRWAGVWPEYGTGPFELPGVPAAVVRVRPADDVSLVPQPGRATKLLPPARPRETVYAADAAAVPPKFTAYPPTPTPLRQAEAVTRAGSLIEQRVTVDVRLAADRPHSFTLDLTRLPAGTDTRVEWPAGVSAAETGGEPGRRRWLVDFAARAEEAVRVVVVNRFPARPEVVLPAVDLLSANVPLAKEAHRLATTDDLQPTAGGPCRRAKNDPAWAVVGDEPVRLVEAAKRPAAAPAGDEPAAVADSPTPAGREGAAAGWLLGLFAVAVASRWGPAWRPEVVVGVGLLAAAVGGWPFAVVAAVGGGLRLVALTRFVGRRVLR